MPAICAKAQSCNIQTGLQCLHAKTNKIVSLGRNTIFPTRSACEKLLVTLAMKDFECWTM